MPPSTARGTSAGAGASADLLDLVGERVLAADVWLETGTYDRARRAAEVLAASAWGASRSYLLGNGSTSGNVASLLAALRDGDTAVVSRTLHTSTLTGLVLSGARPAWVLPPVDPSTGCATGPALSSGSLLHAGSRVDGDRLDGVVRSTQTTSPLLPLLASVDLARRELAVDGHERLDRLLALADEARAGPCDLPGLRVPETAGATCDPSSSPSASRGSASPGSRRSSCCAAPSRWHRSRGRHRSAPVRPSSAGRARCRSGTPSAAPARSSGPSASSSPHRRVAGPYPERP